MITVLLCAGYATRMYPLTRDFPKSLLPVAGKPVLDYFLAQLMDIEGEHAVHVVTNARFAAHFKAWRKDWMKRQASKSTEITIHNDGSTDNDNRLGACRDMAWVFERIPKFTLLERKCNCKRPNTYIGCKYMYRNNTYKFRNWRTGVISYNRSS